MSGECLAGHGSGDDAAHFEDSDALEAAAATFGRRKALWRSLGELPNENRVVFYDCGLRMGVPFAV